jgi:uncharacterized delta-60 repeat protein
MFVDRLESRQLMAGGVDSFFGGVGGVRVDLPGVGENVAQSYVDSAGRTVLAGSGDVNKMVLARFSIDGTLDATFGAGGVIAATPRSVVNVIKALPTPDGGVIVVGRSNGGVGNSFRLIRFRENGTIDTRFGSNGSVTVSPDFLNVRDLLPRSDGGFWLVGTRELDGDNERRLVCQRLLASGKPATNEPLIDFDLREVSDSIATSSTNVLQARVLEDDTLVMLASNKFSFFDDTSSRLLRQTAGLYYLRVNSAGAWAKESVTSTSAEFPAKINSTTTGALVGDSSNLTALVRTNDGNVKSYQFRTRRSPIVTDRTNQFASFNWTGPIVRLLDGALVLGGVTGSAVKNASLIKLNSNFTRETAFGNAGVLSPLTAGAVNDVGDLAITPEGTLAARLVNSNSTQTQRLVHLFRDDRPIATLLRTRTDSSQHRLTVQFRATRQINPATLGDNDLRLVLGTDRYTLRLVNYVVDGNTVTANYRITNSLIPAGTFQLRSNINAVTTVNGNGLIERTIASVVLA